MRIHGLEPRQGETVYAFLVLRFAQPVDRAALATVLRQFAPIVPDADAFLDELPVSSDEPCRLFGMPWVPPEAGSDVELQRRLVEASAQSGVEEAWFFQTGTSLPGLGDEEDDPFSDDDVGMSTGIDGEAYVEQTVDADAYTDDGSEGTQPVQLYPVPQDDGAELEDVDDDDDDEEDADYGDDEEDDEAAWSHGPPPMVASVRFPVDGYPQILEDLDWEDFGIAFKLAGPAVGGESTVLVGFHELWLTPYGGRHRNAAVTIDRRHHSAHLWVDRFAVPSSAEEQVGHLLWILSKLDEIVPVIHARFGGATMQQKYGGLMGDTSEPFVLGGNPLLAIYASGGDQAVDRWIEAQTDWSSEEVAQMLRELAIEIVTGDEHEEEDDDDEALELGDEDVEQAVDALFEDDGADDAKRTTRMPAVSVSPDEEDADEDEDEDIDDDEEPEDRSRYVARYASEILVARARAGLLDRRAADALLPVLATPERFEHRRTRVVRVLGALRDKASVPALVRVLETSPIQSISDARTRSDLLAATADALGAIGDPSAIPALSAVIGEPTTHADKPRAPAAHALAACLAAAPEPRDVPDAVIDSMLKTIALRDDREINAELHLAYGKLARTVSPSRRDEMRARLADGSSSRSDSTPMFARAAALAMTGDAKHDELRTKLHDALSQVDYNHETTVRTIRFALRIAEHFPELVDTADLAWLVTFAEPDIRTAAHELLDKLGAPLPAAAIVDSTIVGSVSDEELVTLLSEPRLVGRASLVAEASKRALAAARPAIVKAAHDAIDRARPQGELLAPDEKLLEAAVKALRAGDLDAEVIALFDRILRHQNHHVKMELLQDPPDDDRLIGGMFVVLAAKWGWQHSAAKEWLSARQGSAAFEEERTRAGVEAIAEPAGNDEDDEDDEDDGDDLDDDDDDDDEMN